VLFGAGASCHLRVMAPGGCVGAWKASKLVRLVVSGLPNVVSYIEFGIVVAWIRVEAKTCSKMTLILVRWMLLKHILSWQLFPELG
jgi:hypothetical protein